MYFLCGTVQAVLDERDENMDQWNKHHGSTMENRGQHSKGNKEICQAVVRKCTIF